MKVNYILDENDYLQFQLYTASKSDRIKKQRKKSWIIMTLAFLSLSFLFYTTEMKSLMYYFAVFSILSLILFPIYSKKRYYNHNKKYNLETYKNRFGNTCTITFDEINIISSDPTAETSINLSAIEEIAETSQYIYLKIKTGGSLIIPKLKVENINLVQTYLENLAEKLKINFNKELSWRWK